MPTLARTPLKLGYLFQPSDVADAFDPRQLTAQARLAEQGRFDFIRFAERELPDGLPRTEPLTTASFLATLTRDIGLIAEAGTSFFEPFNLARLVASLDHVTHGRAGWQVTTGAARPAQANFSREPETAEAHLSRAYETVDVLRKLWDSWEDGAFIRNKATGEYVDGDKIHAIHHAGDLFRIKGPLNVARSPQGHAVVVVAVTDAHSADLAAREADLIFLPALAPQELRAQAEALRARRPQALIFAEAEANADAIEAASETAGLDGVNLRFGRRDALEAYVRDVVPELDARGLLAAPVSGLTLRARLGLAEPANRYAA